MKEIQSCRGKRNVCQVGERYGRLIIQRRWTQPKPVGQRSKETLCECLCDCGNVVVVRGRYLRSQHKQSCGCLHYASNKHHHAWKGHGNISKTFWNDIKNGCTRRGQGRQIPFEITIEQVWDLFVKQGGKCAISGAEIGFPQRCKHYGTKDKTASLDRIDSSKGYTIDNVQWVHKDVNLMKMNFPQEKFLEWCRIITANQNRLNVPNEDSSPNQWRQGMTPYQKAKTWGEVGLFAQRIIDQSNGPRNLHHTRAELQQVVARLKELEEIPMCDTHDVVYVVVKIIVGTFAPIDTDSIIQRLNDNMDYNFSHMDDVCVVKDTEILDICSTIPMPVIDPHQE